jgi:hypothetical protein
MREAADFQGCCGSGAGEASASPGPLAGETAAFPLPKEF